jgi:uncharacterized protein
VKNLKDLFVGIFFGFVLTKGEAISWYRIQEMFHFQGFHMYGIFMTAIPTGALSLFLIRKFHLKSADGEQIVMPVKKFDRGVVFGSLIFGFGWALTGACPGPIYAQIGSGVTVVTITLLAALAGAFTCMATTGKSPASRKTSQVPHGSPA